MGISAADPMTNAVPSRLKKCIIGGESEYNLEKISRESKILLIRFLRGFRPPFYMFSNFFESYPLCQDEGQPAVSCSTE